MMCPFQYSPACTTLHIVSGNFARLARSIITLATASCPRKDSDRAS